MMHHVMLITLLLRSLAFCKIFALTNEEALWRTLALEASLVLVVASVLHAKIANDRHELHTNYTFIINQESNRSAVASTD